MSTNLPGIPRPGAHVTGCPRRTTGGEIPGGIGFSCHGGSLGRPAKDKLWCAPGPSRTGVNTVSSPAQGAAVSHPVTITIDSAHPGPVIPGDFAGLSFERGPLLPGSDAGASGNLFNP